MQWLPGVREELERQREARAFAVAVEQPDEAAMGGHHLPRQRKADARATFLGCEEWHEDLAGDVVRYAGAVVGDFDDDVATAVQPARQPNVRTVEVLAPRPVQTAMAVRPYRA